MEIELQQWTWSCSVCAMADMRLFSSASSACSELLNMATSIFSEFLDHENAFRKGPGSEAMSNATRVQHSGIPARMLCHNLQTDAALNGKSDSEHGSRSIHSQLTGSESRGVKPWEKTEESQISLMGWHESDKRNFIIEGWSSTGRCIKDTARMLVAEAEMESVQSGLERKDCSS